jgi:hypothetical protein
MNFGQIFIPKTADKCVSDQGCQMVYFKPKIPIWVNFGGLAMEDGGIFYGYYAYFTAFWVYFMAVGYIFNQFGIFFPFWYAVPRKIWQPCIRSFSTM